MKLDDDIAGAAPANELLDVFQVESLDRVKDGRVARRRRLDLTVRRNRFEHRLDVGERRRTIRIVEECDTPHEVRRVADSAARDHSDRTGELVGRGREAIAQLGEFRNSRAVRAPGTLVEPLRSSTPQRDAATVGPMFQEPANDVAARSAATAQRTSGRCLEQRRSSSRPRRTEPDLEHRPSERGRIRWLFEPCNHFPDRERLCHGVRRSFEADKAQRTALRTVVLQLRSEENAHIDEPGSDVGRAPYEGVCSVRLIPKRVGNSRVVRRNGSRREVPYRRTKIIRSSRRVRVPRESNSTVQPLQNIAG
mmetsp:Transcript_9879/g.32180  ORF Transcript_9879/g.32180 Transcript_9879/m.32180 type:complete len:308 (-) Transcript_9879:1892-2815(-)